MGNQIERANESGLTARLLVKGVQCPQAERSRPGVLASWPSTRVVAAIEGEWRFEVGQVAFSEVSGGGKAPAPPRPSLT